MKPGTGQRCAAPELEEACHGKPAGGETIPVAKQPRGFSLVELLVVVAILGVLSAITLPVLARAREGAHAAQCVANLRQLAVANLVYSNDHGGRFSPASSLDNRTRWHGARASVSSPFDPSKGYLAPYLGADGRIKLCPSLASLLTRTGRQSFENGAGGYGYNQAYVGGSGGSPDRPAHRDFVRNPSRTVLFTDAALAVAGGLQEYAFSEPYFAVAPSGEPNGFALQPSVHFRHGGRANVAWADGHVSSEKPNARSGPNFYGGDNARSSIGWFGPDTGNGLWDARK